MAVDSKLPRPSALSPPRWFLRWRVRLGNLPFWPRHSVYLRLQWSHLATSLLPLLILGGTLLVTSAQTERRVVERTQQAVAEWAAKDLAGDIQRNEGDLLSFGGQLSFADGDRRTLIAAAAKFMGDRSQTLAELAILDTDGQQLVRMTHERTFFPSELQNDRDKPFFGRALQGGIYHGVVNGEGRRVLELAVPANDAVGRVKGVVVVRLDPRSIESVLKNVPTTTARSAFIVDEQGNVVLGQPASAIDPSTSAPGVSSRMDRWPLLPADGTATIEVGGETRLVAQAAISPGSWWLVIEQPASLALQDARRSTLFVALILSLTGIGVVIWSLLLARRMTQPIRELRDASQLLASGHLGRTIAVTREDELGELAAEFNRMSLRLAESQRALEERNIRLQQGLTLVRHIQQDLLPADGPQSKAVRTYAISEPASEVGGDFYTYLLQPDGRIIFVIGDASGKGVAAALVMALTSTLVEAQAPRESGPGALLVALNAQLYPRLNASHSSVSLLVAEFEPKSRQLRAANAGMIAPLLLGDAECTYVACYGPPLGIVPIANFVEQVVTLRPNQTVVFASDGLVEARNANGEMWGFERMEQALCEVAEASPQTIVEHLRSEIAQFTRNTEPADDMTIIASQFTGVAT